jgi:hypothetical protein
LSVAGGPGVAPLNSLPDAIGKSFFFFFSRRKFFLQILSATSYKAMDDPA